MEDGRGSSGIGRGTSIGLAEGILLPVEAVIAKLTKSEMKINIKKTKAMVVSKKPNSPKINIAIDGQQIEQVHYIRVASQCNT